MGTARSWGRQGTAWPAGRAAQAGLGIGLALLTGAATHFSCSTEPDGTTLIVIGFVRGPEGAPAGEVTLTVEAHAPACPAASPRRTVTRPGAGGAYRATLAPGRASRACVRVIGRPGPATGLAPDSLTADVALPGEGTVTVQLDLVLPAGPSVGLTQ